MNYDEFIENKRHTPSKFGITPKFMPPGMFDYQEYVTRYAIEKGRCAVFLDTDTITRIMNTDISHLEHRLVPDPKTGCLVWPGGKSDKGYAMAVVNGKRVRVHRAVYEKYCGPIPKGLVIDHLCNNKACCNTDHLRACTDKVNILRGNGVAARNNRKTHCPKGHPYSGDNLRTRVHKGCVERLCKACISMQNRARRMVGLPIPDPSA